MCIHLFLIVALFKSYSTPKSTRQGMSSTPAPLASPVPSVDGATPRLLYESDERKVITNYRAPEEKDLPADLKA